MPDASQRPSRLSGDPSLSAFVERFEDAWQAGRKPDLDHFLPGGTDDRAVLVELIHAELELRLKAGEPARVEDYLRRYPDLATVPEVILSLLGREYELRRRHDSSVQPEEYARRFPHLREALAECLPAAVPAAPVETVAHVAADTGEPPTVPHVPGSAGGSGLLPAVPGHDVLEVLGRGGMGIVYKARQKSLKRLVALKMILAGAHAGTEERARFHTEAEAVARLQHPNIVQVHEIGEHQGLSYFSLEFMDGGTLGQQIARQQPALGAAAQLVETLARAVDHAHQRGIIHRDLKPANVLLTADGTPKITDFGLAKQLEGDSGQTRSGAILGTPSYMAPEQAAGLTSAVGPATDVYALGAILYECLTGRPPFKAGSVTETLEQVRTREPVPPSRLRPKLPRDLETICLKALAKDPAQRYASALALANDLARFRAGEPVLARRQGPVRRAVRYLRRRRWVVVAVLGGLLLAAVATVAILSARTSGQSNNLQQGIRTALDQPNVSFTERVAQAESLIAKLEQLDAFQAARQREFLGHSLNQAANNLLERGVLTPEAEAQLREIAGLLDTRDPARAREVREELEKKLSHSRRVFALVAPFGNRAKVFPPERVQVQGQVLEVRPGGATRPSPKDAPNLVLTQVPCQGDVELTALFRFPARGAAAVGLALNATGDGGYTFLVQPPEARRDGAPPRKGSWRLRILRKGVVLREREVPAGETPVTGLEVLARRQGEKLVFQVLPLDGQPLEYRDPFPLPSGEASDGAGVPAAQGGVFGVLWPAEVGLEKLEAFRQARPLKPGPVEEGDDLYERGQFAEALTRYRKVVAGAGEVSQAARYKEGLCLLRLQREQEADDLFREVAAARGDRWPVLADCQLWLLLAARKDARAEADMDAVLERLKSRGLRFEQLAALIPDDFRTRIADVVFPASLEPFLTSPELLVSRARRQAEIRRLLDTGDGQSRINRQQAEEALLRSYRFAGDEDEALRLARQLLRESPALDQFDIARRVLEQTTWILRLRGEGAMALAEVERYRLPAAQAPGGMPALLLPERARVLAALGRREEAEKDLDALLAQASLSSLLAVDACLLKGYLREQAGDRAGAEAAWRRGLAAYSGTAEGAQTTQTVQYLIMAAQVGGPGEADLRKLLGRMTGRFGGSSSGGGLAEIALGQVPAEALLTMWRTPRGKEFARKIAFRDLSLQDYYRVPLLLLAAEVVHQRALPGAVPAEQNQLIWDFVRSGHAAFLAGKLRQDQALLLAGIWKTKSTLLWPGLKAGLDPSLRGPLAYLLGQRFLRDKQPAAAAVFFRDALADAAPGSPLQRLTRAELEPAKPR